MNAQAISDTCLAILAKAWPFVVIAIALVGLILLLTWSSAASAIVGILALVYAGFYGFRYYRERQANREDRPNEG